MDRETFFGGHDRNRRHDREADPVNQATLPTSSREMSAHRTRPPAVIPRGLNLIARRKFPLATPPTGLPCRDHEQRS